MTPENVRVILLDHFSGAFAVRGVNPQNVGDDFDLLMEGIIDSMGIMEMVGALEERLGMEIDFDDLPADDLTIIGPLSRYIAERVNGAGSTT